MNPPARSERAPLDRAPLDQPAWWAGMGPAEMSLNCGGHDHRLRWAEGRLVTPAHPDADRERALVALGGEPVACLELLDTWHAHADNLDLLMLTSRGPSDRLLDPEPGNSEPGNGVRYSGGYTGKSGFPAILNTGVAYGGRGSWRMGRGWTSYRPLNPGSRPAEDGGEFDVAMLAALGGGLTDRLVATVIGIWTDRIREGDSRVSAVIPKLRAALYGRVLTTIRGLDNDVGPIDLTMVGAGSVRAVTEHGGRIRCDLPFSWLGDVWARGLANVLGHFCLNVEQATDDDWQLLVVDRGLRRTRSMIITLS